jgi:cysteine desulfurase
MLAYLDCNATTPLDPRVRATCQPWLDDRFGNASSRDHRFGWEAADAVEAARDAIADATGGLPTASVFVSGATEALNTVLRSYVGFERWQDKKIITCATEHEAVLATCCYLCAETGVSLEILPVDSAGRLDLGQLSAALLAQPGALVALMTANNEIGTLHPIREIARLVHTAGGVLLSDAAQSMCRHSFHASNDEIDFVAVSSHKVYGPKGVGALVGRAAETMRELRPLVLGGGQERGLRGGTVNVAGIVGFGEACRLGREEFEADVHRIAYLRDRLEAGIVSQVPDTWINGDPEHRLCNTSNIGFKGVEGRTLLRDMHDVAASTRSACATGNVGPSHVLKALGLSDADAYACVRFSLGRFTTQDEIDYAIDKVVYSAHRLRRSKSAP